MSENFAALLDESLNTLEMQPRNNCIRGCIGS